MSKGTDNNGHILTMALCYFIQFSNRYGYHQFTQPIQQIDMRLNINYFNFMD